MESQLAELQSMLLVGGLLVVIGLVGFIVRRNLIVMFLSIEMILQGISVSLVAWGRYHGDLGGQMLVMFVITVAACEAGIGLALILALLLAPTAVFGAFLGAGLTHRLPLRVVRIIFVAVVLITAAKMGGLI